MNESKLPFQKTIDELLAGKKSLSRASLRSFSDIDSVSLNLLLEAWPRIAPDRKRLLLDELQTLSDNDTLVSFDDLARALLNDSDAQVQAGGQVADQIAEVDAFVGPEAKQGPLPAMAEVDPKHLNG